jgi:hypothetical protein
VYEAKHGDLLWTDKFVPAGGVGGGYSLSGALAVAIDNGRVFVAGSGFNASGNADFILRVYDAR